MAILNVSEFRDRAVLSSPVDAASIGSVSSQNVTFTTSAQSSAFKAGTSVVRVVADTACYLAFGTNPTAAAGGIYLPAGVVEYFGVPEGQAYKVAAVTA